MIESMSFIVTKLCSVLFLLFALSPHYSQAVFDKETKFFSDITNSFLDSIRGDKSITYSINEISKGIKDNELVGAFKNVGTQYYGFLACIVIGIIFIILMEIVALIFCCCRCCCKNCGGQHRPRESKGTGCRKAVFTVLFLICITLMLMGVVLAGLNTTRLNVLLASGDQTENAIGRFQNELTSLQSALTSTAEDLKRSINSTSQNVTNSVLVPEIKNLTKQFLENFYSVCNIPGIVTLLTNMNPDILSLKANFSSHSATFSEFDQNLKFNLNETKKNITSKCSGHPCETNRTESLNYLIDIKKLNLTIVNATVENLQDLNADKINEQVKNLTEKIQNEILGKDGDLASFELPELNQPIDQLVQMGNEMIANVSRDIKTMKVFDKPLPEALKSDISKYQLIAFTVVYGIMALVLALYYFGMLFSCGERAYEDAGLCNRGVAANLLMAGVIFSFLFCGFLMLIATLLFIPGGLVQTEVCRYATGRQSYSKLDTILSESLSLFDNNTAQVIQKYVSNPMQGLFEGCETKPVGKAFDIDFNYVIQAINLDQFIEKLGKAVDEVEVPENVKNELDNRKTDVDKINNENLTVDSQVNETEKLTEIDNLGQYIQFLKNTSGVNLTQEINYLEAVEESRKYLNEDFIKLARLLNNFVILGSDLKNVTEGFRNAFDNSKSIIKDNLNGTVQNVVSSVTRDVSNEVKCDKLRLSIVQIINLGCVDLLNSLNGFWGGIGVFLLFLIPAIIFAVKLSSIYRKTEKYSSSTNEPEYGNAEMRDNIPLERMDPPKYRTGNGITNDGYESTARHKYPKH